MDEEPLVVVSVDELFVDEDVDVSLLLFIDPLVEPVVEPVPLAPMLDVLLPLFELALLLDELGVEELLLVLGVVLFAVEPIELLFVLLFVDEALVPPPVEEEPDEPPVCAMAIPPTASAAAAANVVRVFLVVLMSFAP